MKKKRHPINKKSKSAPKADPIQAIEELLKSQHDLDPAEAVDEPSRESMARLGAIPLLFDDPRDVALATGAVVYDSWSDAPRVALRDIPDGHVRRLQLKSGKIAVEIVAEMNKGKWEFVARVYRGKIIIHDFVMKIGSKKILPESGGFIRWSSKAMPRKIVLTSIEQQLTFERLSW